MGEVEDMVEDLIRQARKARVMESQSNSHLGFVYFQGVIDMGVDILDNIDRLRSEKIDLKEDNAYC
jgi:hypothetical protein